MVVLDDTQLLRVSFCFYWGASGTRWVGGLGGCCDYGIVGFEPTIRNLRAGLEPARALDGLRAGPGVLLGFRLGGRAVSRPYPVAGRLDPGENPGDMDSPSLIVI